MASRIQIRTEPARLAYEIKVGQLLQRQPKAHFEMRQPWVKMQVQSPPGKVLVDSSRAWDALGVGGNLELMSKIYTNARNIALQGIARRVEEGYRLANIANKEDAVAELARGWRRSFPEFDTVGYASPMNVDVRYEPGDFSIEVEPQPVQLETWVTPPELQYIPGKRNMYMDSYGKVDIIPPPLEKFLGPEKTFGK